MNKQEFLKAVRRDGEKFRTDRIAISTGQEELTGRGTLRVSRDRFSLEVSLDDPTKEVQSPTGIKGRSSFWEIRGVIEDELKFLARGLPSCSSRHFGEEVSATITFSIGHLELEPSGSDRMTYDE